MTAITTASLTRIKANVPLVWQGVFWKVFSCACFAIVNALVRFLSGGSQIDIGTPLPIHTLMMLQNVIGVMLLMPYILRLNKTAFVTRNYKLHLLRVITAVIGIGVWYLSLRYMPITEAIALSFAGPIITIIGAKLFLKEHFTWQRLLAVALSIIGGFLIIRPDKALLFQGYIGFTCLLPILAATIFAGDKLITRKIMQDNESPLILTFYLLLFTAISCTIPSFYYGFAAITAEHIPWILLLGLAAMGAHFTFSKAYELSEVTFLMPFGLSKVVLSGLVSYIAFYEIPNSFSIWVGMG